MFGNDNAFAGDPSAVRGLIKAMTEGDGIATPNALVPGDAAPLNVQDLQKALAVSTYKSRDAVLFKMLQEATYIAKSPTIQYDVLTSYGDTPSIFNNEIAFPTESDDTYVRRTMKAAMMSLSARISFRANAATNIGNINLRSQTTSNKITQLTASIEATLFTGNSALIPQQFDGIEKLIADYAPENLFDRRDGLLNLDFVNQVCQIIFALPNNGRITHIFVAPSTFADVLNEPTATTGGVLRLPNGQADVAFGTNITRYLTQFGEVGLVPDKFIQAGQPAVDLGVGPAGLVPAAPVSGGAITTPVNAASQFAAGDVGTYIYKIAAINHRGFSPVLTTVGAAVAAGDSVNIPVVAGDTITSAYVVYRSDKDGAASTCREAFRVARTGASQTIVDLNAYLPGTARAYFLSLEDMADDGAPNLQWAQLSPLQSIDLATQDTSIRWMIYMDAGLILRVPRRHAVAYNIQRPTGALENPASGFNVV